MQGTARHQGRRLRGLRGLRGPRAECQMRGSQGEQGQNTGAGTGPREPAFRGGDEGAGVEETARQWTRATTWRGVTPSPRKRAQPSQRPQGLTRGHGPLGSTVASGFSKQRSGWEWDGARGEPGGAGRCRGRKPKGTPDREGGCAVAWGRRSPKDRTEQRGGGGGREARGVGPTSGRMGVVSVPAGCSHGPAFLFCPPALPCPLLPCPQGFRHTSLGKTALGKK